jgi:hypothetical protein
VALALALQQQQQQQQLLLQLQGMEVACSGSRLQQPGLAHHPSELLQGGGSSRVLQQLLYMARAPRHSHSTR